MLIALEFIWKRWPSYKVESPTKLTGWAAINTNGTTVKRLPPRSSDHLTIWHECTPQPPPNTAYSAIGSGYRLSSVYPPPCITSHLQITAVLPPYPNTQRPAETSNINCAAGVPPGPPHSRLSMTNTPIGWGINNEVVKRQHRPLAKALVIIRLYFYCKNGIKAIGR